MSIDVNVPDAAGLTIAQRAQMIIDNVLKPWAANQTASNKLSFDNAVATAKATGNPPPTSYVVWGVNAPLVLAIEAGEAKADATLFTQTSVTVPAPKPVVPALVINTDPSVTGKPGLFEAQGDNPSIAVGTEHAQDGHDYIKAGPFGYEFASPYPDKGVYLWTQIS